MTFMEAFAGFLAPLGRWFEQKDSRFSPLLVRFGPGQPVYPDRDAAKIALDAYVRNVIGYAGVRLVSQGAASVKMILFDGDAEIDSHPLLDLLKRPNPFQDGVAFLEALHSFEMISGNYFLERNDGAALDGAAKPEELYVLRPDRVKVIPNARGIPGAYVYSVGGTRREVPINIDAGALPIWQGKTFHPLDDWYGLSQLAPAAWAIDTHSGSGAFNKALLDNAAVPSGALAVVPDKEGNASLDREVRTQMQADLEARFMGSKNAGRPMILEGGLEWQQFGMSLSDMQFIESKRDAARDIALACGVPPMILGIPGDNTYSNYQEANTALWKQTIIPRAQRIARALSMWLCPSYGKNLELRIDLDSIDALAEERAQQWDRVEKSTILTVNEKREALGYETIPDGDVVLVSATLVPLESAATPVDTTTPDDPANPAPVKKPAGGK